MKSSDVLWKLSIQFGLFAIASSVLVGLGQSSVQIPLLVAFCVILSLVFTDWLGYVVIHKYFAYFGMLAGASVAIREYVLALDLSQLYSVANLLIYVQLPLYFQQKSQRIYEQLAVFLLLELVVAALVNDKVLYGLLLLPCLILGCSSLIYFAVYVSSLKAGHTALGPQNTWRHFWKQLWSRSKLNGEVGNGITLRAVVPAAQKTDRSSFSWTAHSLPITSALLFFALCHFFFLPRLHSGAYQGNGMHRASVGFDGTLRLDALGELMRNEEPALRVSFVNRSNGKHYRPRNPPYLRGTVLGHYKLNTQQGFWGPIGNEFSYPTRPSIAFSIPDRNDLSADFLSRADDVVVEIQEEAPIGTSVICIPPMYQAERKTPFHYIRSTLSLSDPYAPRGSLRRYSFGTLGFYNGVDSRFIPESDDLLGITVENSTSMSVFKEDDRDKLTQFDEEKFQSLLKYRDQLLSRSGFEQAGTVDKAIILETLIATSGDLKYSLDLSKTRDNELDPIEDFVRNRKQGHCQYFASTLAMMLRSFGVPTRIVVGFRPSEYNEIGHYFLVRQSHAHAWVEAYFTREQFQSSMIGLPSQFQRGAWFRMDATPSAEGSNSGTNLHVAPLQSFEFAQRLWKDYVLEMDRSKQGKVFELFGETSRNAYRESLDRISHRLIGGDGISSFVLSRFFSWPAALLSIVIIVFLILVRHSWLRWIPRFKRRSSSTPLRFLTSKDIPIDFFRRAIQALERMGWFRAPSQTYSEFLATVVDRIDLENVPDATKMSLNGMAEVYYRIRYSDRSELLESESTRIERSIQSIESLVKERRRGSLP